jgi:hydrogenase maturation factor
VNSIRIYSPYTAYVQLLTFAQTKKIKKKIFTFGTGQGLWISMSLFLKRRMSLFRVGKIPPKLLKSNVLDFLGTPSKSVIVGPAVGEDSAVVQLQGPGRMFAAKTDPITGAAENIGRLVVHVNANDLAASGASPQWFLLTSLFPEGTPMQTVNNVQKQVHETCLSLGVSVVGGHTELSDAVSRPVLVGSMFGPLLTREPIRTGGARPGDVLVLTKVKSDGNDVGSVRLKTYKGRWN